MKYAIYFVWKDNQEDTIICDNSFDKNLNIRNMLERHEFKKISYCKIYKSGEYGKRVIIL